MPSTADPDVLCTRKRQRVLMEEDWHDATVAADDDGQGEAMGNGLAGVGEAWVHGWVLQVRGFDGC